MTEKRTRSGIMQFLDKAFKLVDGLKGLSMILAALSVGGASGTIISRDATPAATDSLKVRVESLETDFGQMRREAMEMYSAQIESDSALRIILEGRAANQRKARESRADAEKLFKEITGGNP